MDYINSRDKNSKSSTFERIFGEFRQIEPLKYIRFDRSNRTFVKFDLIRFDRSPNRRKTLKSTVRHRP